MANGSIQKLASRAEPFCYAMLRIVVGGMFCFHGVQKILHFHSNGLPPEVGSQIWIGGIIELVGGAMVAVGLMTRLAAFICSGQMAVAYFQFHWKFALASFMWIPGLNKGEQAVTYCFIFLYIAAKGAGMLSVDGMRRG